MQRQTLFILIAIAVLALLLGMWFQHNTTPTNAQPKVSTATIFDAPRTLTAFELTDDKGQPFTLASLKGHWSLLFFGFTNCPDLCPTTLSTLAKAYQTLASAHQNPMPQVVFISVDPERDTTARIHQYLKNFDTHFIGATGDKATLDTFTQELSVLYAKITQEDHYSIDHSGTIIIINPEGQFYGVFTMPHEAEKIAEDMKTIIQSNVNHTTIKRV